MTDVFTLPDLGEGLTDAQLVRWLVSVGDTVAVDGPVAEVETAKAMVEVPCPYAGVVARLHGEAGDVIAVGAPLVSVEPVDAGTDPEPAEPGPTTSGNVLIGYGTSEAQTRGAGRRGARRAAREAGPEAPVPARAPAPTAVAVASPLVRSLAKANGVDLRALRGTGPDGLIVRADVERAIRAGDAPPPAPTSRSTDPRTGLPVAARVPISGVRRVIAERLTRSRQEIPEATTWVDVDATALLALRATLASADRPAPGLTALLARFVVAGLARFPALNAWVDGDGEQIVHLAGVNLGIATQTDRGLVVPVVRAAHDRGIRDLDADIRRLTAAAREGRATSHDLTGGSFTLNNYGTLGTDGSAAIINHPEVAILGIGRILPRPWVVDGEIVVRSIAQLSLVFDHRVCDGGTAGGFLRLVADAVERPVAALVDL